MCDLKKIAIPRVTKTKNEIFPIKVFTCTRYTFNLPDLKLINYTSVPYFQVTGTYTLDQKTYVVKDWCGWSVSSTDPYGLISGVVDMSLQSSWFWNHLKTLTVTTCTCDMLYLRNNLGFCQVCREITAEGLLITSWGSSAAEGGYQISPRRLFHAQTWQKAQIIPIIIYWASYVSMF